MPEIAITGLPLDYPHSGTAVYTRNLVRRLPEVAPDLGFQLLKRYASPVLDRMPETQLHTPFASLSREIGLKARLDKLSWEIGLAPLAAMIHGADLLHYTYFAAPPLSSARIVVTIHDLVPLILPGYHRSRQAAMYAKFMAWTAKHAAAILTVSHYSKRDILRVLHFPASRIYVTREAVDGEFRPLSMGESTQVVRAKYGLPERFVLYVGSSERRKNLEMLVRAWSLIATEAVAMDVHLVLVTHFPPPDALYPDVPRLIRDLKLEDSVTIVSEIDEQDIPEVYRAAEVFCYPSLYEGFGLPPLEAMASGIPTLAARATSLPEVVGDGGMLIDPDDIPAWAGAIVELLRSDKSRAHWATLGLAQSRRFDWRRTTEETASVYRRVLAR